MTSMRAAWTICSLAALAALVFPSGGCGGDGEQPTQAGGAAATGPGGGPATGGGAGEGGGADAGMEGAPDGTTACGSDADCAGSPTGGYCHLDSGACVACLPSPDTCDAGTYCDPKTHTCQTGCADDADCAPPTLCDVAQHVCVGCLDDEDCAPGSVCQGGACVEGCTESHPCPAGLSCCDAACVDTESSLAHCGMCGAACPADANTTFACVGGACNVAGCDAGWADCNGGVGDGCEVDTGSDLAHCGACAQPCAPLGATAICSGGACGYTACDPGRGDCNGVAADGCEVDLDKNVDHCSACGAACSAQGGTPSCTGGVCGVSSCNPGAGDCDGDASNGCETSIVDNPTHCGGCGKACVAANATTKCGGTTCSVDACHAGWGDCDGAYANGCETSLKTLASCGACGQACNLPNAGESCATGSCEITSCSAWYADCNGQSADGCEVYTANSLQHCGGCGKSCGGANGVASCSGGACSVTCNAGYGNCDGSVANGCETATASDVQHCGGCGKACSTENGTPDCAGGTCSITCSPGFGNCDGLADNGCEVNFASDPAHCGGCGKACSGAGGTPVCSSGTCGIACEPGFANCDGNVANGCETSTSWDISNCGGCGQTCSSQNGSASCFGGSCDLQCYSGWGNCDGSAANGCETSLYTLANCGQCGAACDIPKGSESCDGGSCVLVACDTGWGECNGNLGDGCETNLTTSLEHCGGCGKACSTNHATPSCSGGACSVTCQSGWGNCDGLVDNGCETQLNTTLNCGACGVSCSANNGTASCSGGSCAITCNSGYANCDGNPGNGCEANLSSPATCGSCGNACGTANGTASCSGGVCSISCSSGWGNCDGVNANGCETSLKTNTNCGSCGTPCDYLNAQESCSTGTCVLTACDTGWADCDSNSVTGCEMPGITTYFTENFANNAKGWTLGPEWAIGPTSTSSGHSTGYGDPALDHTATSDNGVAGVVLGGNAATNLHGYYWLTSPVINLTTAATAVLTFWRWLNSDYTPYMANRVEVYNGLAWTVLWESGSSAITDSAWVKQTLDVTAYKSASFQLRIGFSIGSTGVWTMSQWNVDDVMITSVACP